MRVVDRNKGRIQGHRLFGLMLCALLFFFAVGTKMAVYHQQQQANNLTSARVWENDQIFSTLPAPSIPETISAIVMSVFATAALFALTGTLFGQRQLRLEHSAAVPVSRWLWPSLAVRPPPSV